MMYSRNLRRLAGALILAAGLAGCESALAPGEEAFDAEATTADLQTVDGTFETEAYKSLEILGADFGVPGSALAMASAELLQVEQYRNDGSLGARAVEISREINAALQSSFAPLIPEQYLGTTMVWNGEEYVVDEQATGAPANGIRFILYAHNPVTDRIHDELTEIGYADVMDVGGDNSSAIQLVVVSGDVTYVDYTVTATGVFNAPTITIAGYLSDGEEQVDFTLVHSLTATFASVDVSIDYQIDIESRDFSLSIAIDVSEANEVNTTTVDITVQHGRNTVTVEGSTENGEGSLEVAGNGEPFATIHLNGDAVEVVGADGEPLNERQINALRNLMEMLEKAFEAHENLFRPVAWLFNIG